MMGRDTTGDEPQIPRNSDVHYHQVIDNAVRADMAHLVDEQPGLSIQEISEAVGLSRGAVRHHLSLLAKQGYVAAYRQGNQRLHFTTNMPPMRRKAVYLLRIGSLRSFVEGTIDAPKFRPSQLAQKMGLSNRSVRRALNMLEKADLAQRQRSPNQRGVYEVSYHPELRIVWSLYIKGAGRTPAKTLRNSPGWLLGFWLGMGKLAMSDAGS